ncbi:MAG: CRISPR-associated endonuclease Cas2 [Candidatus Hydrogenedentes bacterium]|nr:CRISPR-associated endonuclease Cas2 [Candidatus Hydrogenedentota bacterium]
MTKECWLICYDITAPRRLRSVAKLMTQHGARVQKSVFECWLHDRERSGLQVKVEALLKQGDSVRYYRLCKDCRQASHDHGGTAVQEITQYYIA